GSIRFVPRWPVAKNTTPVTLPLGRLRLATRPFVTGSSPVTKIIGMVSVAVLATSGRCIADDHSRLASDEFRREARQPTELIVRPTIFDRHVLALDKSLFLQTLLECRHEMH